ncbi:MAG: YdcH family protein [Nitrospirota bacterium]
MEENEELIGYARRESEEFRRLEREHRDLDRQIGQKFGVTRHLTPEEEVEKKTLQKQKLARKDRMFEILHELKAVV